MHPYLRFRSTSFLLGIALLGAACGSATTSTSTSSTSSSTSSSETTSSGGSAGITVGDSVLTASLKTGDDTFGTSAAATQDANGITLHVTKPAGGYAFSTPLSFSGIPDDMTVRVHIDAPSDSKLYYGLSCRGLDQNNTYLLLVDNAGDYGIIQVRAGNQTPLKVGSAAFTASGTVTLDMACVSPAGDDNTNRLVLTVNGRQIATVDDSVDNVAGGNSFALFAVSPNSTTGTGDVTFHDLQVWSASSD